MLIFLLIKELIKEKYQHEHQISDQKKDFYI